MNDIKDEAYNVLMNELRRNNNGNFYLITNYSDIEYQCSEQNISTIKVKINKLIEKLNSSTEEEINEILNLDFQEKIYDTL